MYKTLIKPLFSDVKTFVLDTLFPISCLACGAEGSFVCADCKSLLKKLEHQRCIVCQRQAVFGLTHPRCQTPFCADALISFYDYRDEKVSQILINGKYSFLPGIYETLGQMLAARLKADYRHIIKEPTYLTPIPLHAMRHRWRGFNQAEVLCAAMAKELNMEVADVLVRNKITKTQKDLKRADRLTNMQNAFKLNADVSIRNQNFILVDDVTTTGATLQEAAKVLKRNGAAKVVCLTVARD